MLRLAPALVLAALLAPGTAAAAQPLEGTWHFAGGQVLVEPTGPQTFKGTVVVPTRFARCDHPAGERMWEIERRTGNTFAGTHVWYTHPGCGPRPGGRAIWRVHQEPKRLVLEFCTTEPGRPAPSDFGDGECMALERAKPPENHARSCAGSSCVSGPRALATVGCLPPDGARHRFRLSTRGRRPAVRLVRFSLDGRALARDRRAPWVATVPGARLRTGADHVLRADVLLRDARTGRSARRRVAHRFSVCER